VTHCSICGEARPAAAVFSGLISQPGRELAVRRQLRHPFGERLPRALRVAALAPDLHPSQVHRIGGPAYIPRPGHHRLMYPARDHAATRARPGGLPVRDRPHLNAAARAGLHHGDLQTLDPEQRRRRILDHGARGFLAIMNP
jgi:hypothetical protein